MSAENRQKNRQMRLAQMQSHSEVNQQEFVAALNFCKLIFSRIPDNWEKTNQPVRVTLSDEEIYALEEILDQQAR